MKAWLVIGTLGLAACGAPVAFQGQGTLAVNGAPPAPPPVEAAAPPRVEVRDNKIEIHEKIQFDYDKATIKPESFSLMDEIGAVITKNPQIKQIRVEGYASSEGDAKHNKQLSDARAKAVMKYLVDHKIPAAALTAMGYGIEHPIADNATDDGREKNRRVEFTILAQDVTKKKVEIDPATGKEKVVEEKKETITAPAKTDDATATQADTKPDAKTKAKAKTAKTAKKGG